MAEFPALPLFTDAYLADTRHLTAEEHGAYLLLLMCAWRTRGCALKDCDRTLARTVGVTKLRWKRLRPTLMEFFTVSDGLWWQKKLTEVYKGVEARVAKNRANGAKGGRARAAREKAASTGVCHGGGGDELQPTKTRIQNPKPKAAGGTKTSSEPNTTNGDDTPAQLAAAAGLLEKDIDTNVLCEWQAAGAQVGEDILPTLARIAAREKARKGRVPKSLAYYSKAVLEARDARLGAVAAGEAHAANHPPAPEKRAFNPDNVDDWRLFLGDASSRFRGDYVSQNWAISRDNPHFKATGLGPDPRHSTNARIPKVVMDEYGALWRWRRQ